MQGIKKMSELVLALHISEIAKQAQPTGLSSFDLNEVDQQAYALLPRHLVDDKKVHLESNLTLGKIFPQILGYFQIVNQEGRILTYQRKGKEKGLVGKWSIGVGGHVSHEDFMCVAEADWEALPNLNDIIYEGSKRELEEELGIDSRWLEVFDSPDSFAEGVKSILHTWEDSTSTMHVGLPMQLEVTEHVFGSINLDPAEFLNYQWMTVEELKLSNFEFEPWTKLLLDNM